MPRLLLIASIAALMVGGALLLRSMQKPDDSAWQAYKARFVSPEGRVIDTGNGGISHSEGQSYAMLFAVAYDDQKTFDQVWAWTRDTLKRPDGLFSWRYDPKAAQPIADRNNATDGDLVMAWALLRAADRWGRAADRDAALTIATALKAVIVRDGEDAFLLPAADGFTAADKRIVNLSYWVFPALQSLATVTNDPIWTQTIATGLRLSAAAKIGPHQLPPDWLETMGQLRPANGFPPRFGYDAIRLPLYLVWGGHGDAAHIGAMAEFWNNTVAAGAPAWTDLTTDAVSPEKQSPGMAAIAQLTVLAGQGKTPPAQTRDFKTGDYYSTSLLMLCTLAEAEHGKP